MLRVRTLPTRRLPEPEPEHRFGCRHPVEKEILEQETNMQTYFVTGAMGFIGSHWCEHLLRQGKKVIGLDIRKMYPRLLEYENFIFVHDTINNTKVVERCIDASDCVCHFCGIATPKTYVTSPAKVIDVTAKAGLEIINLCRLKGKLFFFTSTSEIYGKNMDVPFREDGDRTLGSTATHRWCYSTSKALLEHYLVACAENGELDFITVRLFNVYGPRLTGRVASTFLKNAIDEKPLIVHGDGSQTRSFTYVDDVIAAFEQLIAAPQCYNSIYNIGNPTETSIRDFAQIVRDLSGTSAPMEFRSHKSCYGDSYEDIPRRVPDISRINACIGWEPTTPLADGLRRTIASMREEKRLLEEQEARIS